MAENKLVAAIIGVGAAIGSGKKGGGHQIGYTHATMYQRSRGVRLAGGADINKENLDAFAAKFSVKENFSDYREMLRRLKPDIVSICTYVGLHRRMIEDCAEAGVKGIFCEKPFANSPVDLAAVTRAVEKTGVKIVIAHIRRYQKAFDRVRQLLSEGVIGEPIICTAGIQDWDLAEWGSHWLDIFRFFHGDKPLKWVMGQARVRQTRGYGHLMEEHAVAYFDFEGGGRGLLDGGVGMNGKWSMTITGTAGSIRVLGEHLLEIDTESGRRTEDYNNQHPVGWEGLGLEVEPNGWQELWDVALAELAAWIGGGAVPRLGYPRTMGSAELMLGAYVSALRGDRVDLPLSGADALVDRWPIELINAPAGRG